MFRILKNVVRVNSTEKEMLLGVEFTFTLCDFVNETISNLLCEMISSKTEDKEKTLKE